MENATAVERERDGRWVAERKGDGVTERRRCRTERDQIWISGLGWYVIRRTMGGRNGGFAGRSHRGNSAGTSPGQIRQEQQPNPVEPPRWFTARRKLVKFKSTFKTGLARCPAPPAAGTAGERYRRAPTGVYRSNILGKLRMDFPPQPISSSASTRRFFFQPSLPLLPSQTLRVVCTYSPLAHENSSNKLGYQIVDDDHRSRYLGRRHGGDVVVVVESDAFSFALKLFPRRVLEEI